MRRASSLSFLCLAAYLIFSPARAQVGTTQSSSNAGSGTSELVDLKADIAYPYKINDSTEVLCLVGNFAAQHNGAVITADSALRFENDMLKCFGNVLINKNTTYAYSDSATYDNKLNQAILFSPIVKVVDEDITLYARKFAFNTKENYGKYEGGGFTIREKKSVDENGETVFSQDLMESLVGYYFSDDKRVTGVREVELQGEGYKMRGDSIIYVHSKEEAFFFKNTNIWNAEEDYIFGDLGRYVKKDDRYIINDKGYVLTDEQEVWSDSIDYYKEREHAILRHNVQVNDFKNESIVLGDYGEYWGKEDKILLTNRPSVLNFDAEQGLSDTVSMRGDTILITTHLMGEGPFAEQTKHLARVEAVDEEERKIDSESTIEEQSEEKPTAADGAADTQSLSQNDEQANEEVALKEGEAIDEAQSSKRKSRKNRRKNEDEQLSEEDNSHENEAAHSHEEGHSHEEDHSHENEAAHSHEEGHSHEEDHSHKNEAAHSQEEGHSHEEDHSHENEAAHSQEEGHSHEETTKSEEPKVPTKREQKQAERAARDKIKLDATRARYHRQLLERQEKLEKRIEKKLAKGRSIYADSLVLLRVKGELKSNEPIIVDSLKAANLADSLAADSLQVTPTNTLSSSSDSTYRVVTAYRNVKVYKPDFQLVCDSLQAFSYDSIIRLYQNPVLWSSTQQIVSETMELYTKEGELDYADFKGNPISASQVSPGDTVYFNQVSGKDMQTYFANNEVIRNEVNGNVRTIYFITDEKTGIVTTISTIESGEATFYIKNNELDGVLYRSSPSYVFAPLDGMPADMSLNLPGFKWYAERKPARDSVVDRTIKPSIKEEKLQIKQPTFPIKASIEREQERLESQGVWFNRDEKVSKGATEWMRTLGFEPGTKRPEGSELGF